MRAVVAVLLAATTALVASCGRRSSAVAASGHTVDSIEVPVLVYHSIAQHHAGQSGEQRELDVDTSTFRRQMDYLEAQGHPVVPLMDLIDQLEGKRELPARAVVITFDDGWQDQYEFAFPILKQHRFTATFFVYTNAIGNGPAFMTWDELRDLQHAGMTIGAHSRTHPRLTDPKVSLEDEIDGSRSDIARELGVSPQLFAYPYGDWNQRVVASVRAAGFSGARGMGDGPTNTPSTIFTLRSILATDDMPAFKRVLVGRAGNHPPDAR